MKQTVIKLVNGGDMSVYVNGDEFPMDGGPLEILVNDDGTVILNGRVADKNLNRKVSFNGTAEQALAWAKSLK